MSTKPAKTLSAKAETVPAPWALKATGFQGGTVVEDGAIQPGPPEIQKNYEQLHAPQVINATLAEHVLKVPTGNHFSYFQNLITSDVYGLESLIVNGDWNFLNGLKIVEHLNFHWRDRIVGHITVPGIFQLKAFLITVTRTCELYEADSVLSTIVDAFPKICGSFLITISDKKFDGVSICGCRNIPKTWVEIVTMFRAGRKLCVFVLDCESKVPVSWVIKISAIKGGAIFIANAQNPATFSTEMHMLNSMCDDSYFLHSGVKDVSRAYCGFVFWVADYGNGLHLSGIIEPKELEKNVVGYGGMSWLGSANTGDTDFHAVGNPRLMVSSGATFPEISIQNDFQIRRSWVENLTCFKGGGSLRELMKVMSTGIMKFWSNAFVAPIVAVCEFLGRTDENIAWRDHMSSRNIVAWNCMIVGYVSRDFLKKAFDLLNQLEQGGFRHALVIYGCMDVVTTLRAQKGTGAALLADVEVSEGIYFHARIKNTDSVCRRLGS